MLKEIRIYFNKPEKDYAIIKNGRGKSD